MSLSELISGVENHQKTVTVFNTDESVVSQLREYFTDRNVSVVSEATDSGRPGQFVTLSEHGKVLTATSLETLEPLLDGEASLGLDERPYSSLLAHLDETMFTSWDTQQMVAASREIEDRAFRVDSGTLHAGFQYTSTLTNELPVYERLGSTNVDVHAYAVPDSEFPQSEGLTLHVEQAEELERSWFVVFDGGTPETHCALLAEERSPRSFYGFWTYDESTVDWLVEYLDTQYDTPEQ
jgi:DICT domain-containing protein